MLLQCEGRMPPGFLNSNCYYSCGLSTGTKCPSVCLYVCVCVFLNTFLRTLKGPQGTPFQKEGSGNHGGSPKAKRVTSRLDFEADVTTTTLSPTTTWVHGGNQGFVNYRM